MLTIIAAAAENNALGKDNKLIWHLPLDFKRFKKLTSGHCIIMGRKTFESLPGILPKRKHIVITRQENYKVKEGVTVVSSLEEAIKLAYKEDDTPYIIGGGEIYKQSMEFADVIELTRVHATMEADTFFPDIDMKLWDLVNEEFIDKDEKHNFNFSFLSFNKRIT